jgi:hypothetical protein
MNSNKIISVCLQKTEKPPRGIHVRISETPKTNATIFVNQTPLKDLQHEFRNFRDRGLVTVYSRIASAHLPQDTLNFVAPPVDYDAIEIMLQRQERSKAIQHILGSRPMDQQDGFIYVLKLLRDLEVDPNTVVIKSKSLCYVACWKSWPKGIALLKEMDYDFRNDKGRIGTDFLGRKIEHLTSLYVAVEMGHIPTLDALAKAGYPFSDEGFSRYDPHSNQLVEWRSPLAPAVTKQDPSIIEALARFGYPMAEPYSRLVINRDFRETYTALLLAFLVRCYPAIKALRQCQKYPFDNDPGYGIFKSDENICTGGRTLLFVAHDLNDQILIDALKSRPTENEVGYWMIDLQKNTWTYWLSTNPKGPSRTEYYPPPVKQVKNNGEVEGV